MKFLLFVSFLFIAGNCLAQRQNVYFLKNNGSYVDARDSADYVRVVREPDSASTLYNVFEFYLNGAKKLIGKSSRIDPPNFEGQCIKYYKNGKKESVSNYKDNILAGTEYDFFPNGKPYLAVEYPDNKALYNSLENNYSITANYDSLGKVLVENGNGYYIGYSSDFKNIFEEGTVKDGKRAGTWKGHDKKPGVAFTENYQAGVLISGSAVFDDGKTIDYAKSRSSAPQFKGGVQGFGRYLSNNIKYPDLERQKNIEGTVILSFVVEKDGRLTDVKVSKSVSPGLDSEAYDVIKDSPKWIPGMMFGRPVRVVYSVPVRFSLN